VGYFEENASLFNEALGPDDIDEDAIDKVLSDIQKQAHQDELAKLRGKAIDNDLMKRLQELKRDLPQTKTISDEAKLKKGSPVAKQKEEPSRR